MEQMTQAARTMRQQADRSAKAMKEQARTMRDMSGAAEEVARRIAKITRANREHSTISGTLVTALGDARAVTERNVRAVRETKAGPEDLLQQAHELAGIIARTRGGPGARGNGRR